MADNHNHHNQLHSNGGLPQDAQGRWWEMLSPTQVFTGEQQQQQQQQIIKIKKKCHGNRKLQHFKRKCRAHSLTEEEITTLINKRNSTTFEQLLNDQTTIYEQTNTTIRETNKRKRILSTQDFIGSPIKSMSQLSISQDEEVSKKLKNSTTDETVFSNNDNRNQSNQDNCILYKASKYLKMPRKLLFHSLHLQLNYRLKWKKKERRFILSRLELFDQQFCLDQIRYLYQTYFNLGLQHEMWPDDILQIIPSNEPNVIQKYLEDYLILLQNKINEYTTELITQLKSCPSTLPHSLEILDQRLKEFVRLHHLDLLRTINYQICKFNFNIHIKKLSKQLSSYHLTTEQNKIIDRLVTIRQKQLKIFENLTMFEQQILCHKLPNSFNSIKDDHIQEQCINKRHKIIQDLKRRMLNAELEQYEIQIQNYEYQYEQELTTFNSEISKTNSSYQMCQLNILTDLVKNYVYHHTKILMRKIRYKESCLHIKLVHRRRRRPPHQSSPTKKIIDVYPQIIVDVAKVSLNQIQLDYLSHTGPNYIRPNQSFLYSYTRRHRQSRQEHKNIMNTITPYLSRVHHIPNTAIIIKQLSQELETYLDHRYMSSSSLSYLDIYRTRKELKLIKSIQFRIKKENYILRVTDKSGIFHLGHAKDYEQKAEAYRQKTGAYIELENDPLWIVFDKVVHLLNDLRSKDHIRVWQLNQMMPKRDQVALAYLYFIPKPHKQGTPLRPIVSSMNTPTTGISKFLDKLLRPLFDKHVRSTTIIDGVDLIRRLETYVENDYLKPTTQLCTFDITDLYTMLPQEESLNVLTEFLLQHGYHKVKGIPIDAIRKLARIVLTENVFIYGKKFYRQIIGGAMGSAFTLTLANIFMWKWEQQLVHRQLATNEIYGRYIDDIFFTSNESVDVINQILDEANNFHPNIKLVRQFGTSVSFLDVFLENKNGVLATSVYHKEAAEPYIVPFNSDHPRHIFKNIIDTALLRAMCSSSTLAAFNKEQRSIKLMLLYNGYPPRYIYTVFIKFFTNYLRISNIMPLIDNEHDFRFIRGHLMDKPTPIEHQIASRIAKTIHQNSQHTVEDPLVRQELRQKSTFTEKFIIHYIHEARLQTTKIYIHQLWKQTFKQTSIMNTKLIIGNRNSPNLTRTLVHRRPQKKPIDLTTKNKPKHHKLNKQLKQTYAEPDFISEYSFL